MQTSALLRRPLAALLPLALLLASVVATSAQTVINSLPYTITVAGDYVLGGNLSVSQQTSNLIQVNASNVTIDLQGYYLSGPANYSSVYYSGIYAYERANITVRNGTISHCQCGVFLDGNTTAASTNNLNQTIDGLRISHCVEGIILNTAPGSTVTNCKLTQIDGYGMHVLGAGSTVQSCFLSQIGTTGIYLGAGSFARQNTISTANTGIAFGLYQDNLASGCPYPFYQGTNGGGNVSN